MAETKRTFSIVRKSFILCAGASLLLSTSFSGNRDVAHAKDPDKNQITVSPTPQHMKIQGESFPLTSKVGLVTGEDTDSAAVDQVKDTLHEAGVGNIVERKDGSDPDTSITIWMGKPSDNAGVKEAFHDLDIEGPKDLKREGYVLASGKENNNDKEIVLAGKDATGTFYAAQTFDQLLQSNSEQTEVPSVKIRDWPQMGNRSAIEGFYGEPWSHQDRLNQMDFYGKNKMNMYVYAPKDDPYHRDKWREPYPKKKIKQIKELVQRAKENHVQFTFALSPGKSVCYSDNDDFQALKDKMQTMYDIGVRSFAIFFDDIGKALHCSQDKKEFGDSSSPSASGQAYLLNRFNKEFIKTHKGTDRLITVPIDYTGIKNNDYKRRFANKVDQDVIFYWTGTRVAPAKITTKQARKAKDVYKHDLLIWDNYTAHDYNPNDLLLGPYTGRSGDLSDEVLGVTANPMDGLAEASKITLFTVADYAWNSKAYNPKQSWEQSVKAFGGDEADAFKTFAENAYSSRFIDQESLTLNPLIKKFWDAYGSDDDKKEAQKLVNEFENIAKAPKELRNNFNNESFLKNTKPWLDKLELYGKAGEAAVKMLEDQKEADNEGVWKNRLKLENAYRKANKISQKMGSGVIKPFLDKTIDMNNEWLEITQTKPTTTMGSYQGYDPKNMIDNDSSTYFWSNEGANSGDAVGIDLGNVFSLKRIKILMGPDKDYIRRGVLEYSRDGQEWHELKKGKNESKIQMDDLDMKARYVRYRATADQTQWVKVREFQVASNKMGNIKVEGEPSASDNTSLTAATDGDVGNYYKASRVPEHGESLEFTLPNNEKINHLQILQDPLKTVNADIEVKNEHGNWVQAGRFSKGYNKVRIGQNISKIRLLWEEGSEPPKIHEVIPQSGSETTTSEDIISLVEGFQKDGEFQNNNAVHSLKIHLTAIRHYENKEETDKIVKHLKTFQSLLDQQKNNKQISKKAYYALKANADHLLKRLS